MSDVKLFKLTSGEEILATKMSSSNGTATVIEDAVTLVYHQTEQGSVSVGFSPFMPYHEGSIELFHSAIAAESNAQEQVVAEYNRIFSKIVIAPANAI